METMRLAKERLLANQTADPLPAKWRVAMAEGPRRGPQRSVSFGTTDSRVGEWVAAQADESETRSVASAVSSLSRSSLRSAGERARVTERNSLVLSLLEQPGVVTDPGGVCTSEEEVLQFVNARLNEADEGDVSLPTIANTRELTKLFRHLHQRSATKEIWTKRTQQAGQRQRWYGLDLRSHGAPAPENDAADQSTG